MVCQNLNYGNGLFPGKHHYILSKKWTFVTLRHYLAELIVARG